MIIAVLGIIFLLSANGLAGDYYAVLTLNGCKL